MAAVEVIGTDNIAQIIKDSKLSKFIVYRFGSGKGATPVYESLYTKTSEGAAKSFEDWAEICLRDNPFNTNPYEIFLYQKEGAAEDVLGDDDASEKETARTNVKRNKRRFSFMLASPYGNNHQRNDNSQGRGLSVSEEVARAIKDLKTEIKIKELEDKIKELEEDEGQDSLTETFEMLKMMGNAKKKKSLSIAEDELEEEEEDDELEEEEEDDELEEEEEEATQKTVKAKVIPQKKFTTEQRLRINKALHILRKKSPRIDKDLMKLAQISVKNPGMFETMINSLRKLQL